MNLSHLSIYCVFLVFTCALLLVNHVETDYRKPILTLTRRYAPSSLYNELFERTIVCLGLLNWERKEAAEFCNDVLFVTFRPDVYFGLADAQNSRIVDVLEKMVSQRMLNIRIPKTIEVTIQSELQMTHPSVAELRKLFEFLMKSMLFFSDPRSLYYLADDLALVPRRLPTIVIDIGSISDKFENPRPSQTLAVEELDFLKTSELTNVVIGALRDNIRNDAVKPLLHILTLILHTRHNPTDSFLKGMEPQLLKMAASMIGTLLKLETFLSKFGNELNWIQGNVVGSLTSQITSTINAYVKKGTALNKTKLRNLIRKCRGTGRRFISCFPTLTFEDCEKFINEAQLHPDNYGLNFPH